MKAVVIPFHGAGHTNACVGLALKFRERGHEAIFLVTKSSLRYVDGFKFERKVLTWDMFANLKDEGPGSMYSQPPEIHERERRSRAWGLFLDYVKQINSQVKELLQEIKPDVIFVDMYVNMPAVIESGLPWVHINSSNPLIIYQQFGGPPVYSGYSVHSSKESWKEYLRAAEVNRQHIGQEIQDFFFSQGVDWPHLQLFVFSPYLNIYVYPEDVDYEEIASLPENYVAVDSLVRLSDESPLGVDLGQLRANQKSILFSLGTLGSMKVDLMKKMIGILAKSPHQFIVSKGPKGDEYELPSNMIGANYLNQMAILPKVDLVIFHGGNNTFVECLYFAKPMIILPMFFDQFDNGTRIEDLDIGRSFRFYELDEVELLEAIDSLLNDSNLHERLYKISQKMKTSQKLDQAIGKVENLINACKKCSI